MNLPVGPIVYFEHVIQLVLRHAGGALKPRLRREHTDRGIKYCLYR